MPDPVSSRGGRRAGPVALALPAVGATGENTNAGSVGTFRATASGITATGAFTFGAGTLGTVAAKARLGSGFAYGAEHPNGRSAGGTKPGEPDRPVG
ncbi:hypothetical protein M2271_001146 [Streptomyces sp. LBL]|uniref:hypothetical protein n=1 Tax=Streptomyces sp. LBL TaxID=2940562 RepID=UPI00247B45B6|nr:hypothetical protein [Streptomyces sp. LBL]